MKRLRRFNESFNTLDKEYIKDCFVEFLDDPDNYIYMMMNPIEIHIDLPVLYDSDEIDFNKIVDMNNQLNEIYSELQTCIDKVKIKYDYKYDIEFEFDESISTVEFSYKQPTNIIISYEI
jgi:hypothetical protein